MPLLNYLIFLLMPVLVISWVLAQIAIIIGEQQSFLKKDQKRLNKIAFRSSNTYANKRKQCENFF
jgi:hypothetical protein